MLRWFDCPGGERIEVKDCLDACPAGKRCLTLPTLVKISSERPWTGEASTTQLLNGTKYEFLRLTNDYTMNPRSDKAFALLGTEHHDMLEHVAEELGLPAELSLTGDGRNVFDVMELEGDAYVLTDYKTWGAFKVAKTFGIVIVNTVKEAYVDGTGKKRTRTIHTRAEIPEQGDWFEVGMQQNRYRMMIEAKGLPIKRTQVQVTVRDGGLKATYQYGIMENMYLRDVPYIPDTEVTEYFDRKQSDLAVALDMGGWPDMCSEYECWDGRRCGKYCEVWEHCPRGKQERMING